MRGDATSLCCPSPKCLDSVIVQPESGGDLRQKATMFPHPSVCNRASGVGTWWQRPCLWEGPIVFVISTLPAPPAIQRGIVNSSGTNPMQSKLLAAYNAFHSPAATGLSNLASLFPPHIAALDQTYHWSPIQIYANAYAVVLLYSTLPQQTLAHT